MNCSLPGSSIHGIFQARILEWVAISSYRRSSAARNWSWVSRIIGRHFIIWATREVLEDLFYSLTFMRKEIFMRFGSFMLLNLTFSYNVAFNPILKNVILDSKDFMSLLVFFVSNFGSFQDRQSSLFSTQRGRKAEICFITLSVLFNLRHAFWPCDHGKREMKWSLLLCLFPTFSHLRMTRSKEILLPSSDQEFKGK